MRPIHPLAGLACGIAVLLCAAAAREPFPPADAADTPIPLVTGRFITPQGTQTPVGSFPANMAPTPDGRYVVVTNAGFQQYLSVLRTDTGALVSQQGFNAAAVGGRPREGLYFGLACRQEGQGTLVYASRGAEDRISMHRVDAVGKLTDAGRALDNPAPAEAKLAHHVAGVALSSDGSRLFAVNNQTGVGTRLRGSLSVLETQSGRRLGKISLPGFPYDVAALTAGPQADRKLYVSSERDGVVSVVDLQQQRVVRDLPTGDHPTSLLLDHGQQRLFVANAGSDTVSVIDTAADRITDTILVRPDDARGLPGATPLGMALSPDEKTLYVVLADMNAIAVVRLPEGELDGYVPVGWYPTAVCTSPDGRRLLVANAKGVGVRNPNAANLDLAQRPAGRRTPNRGDGYIQELIEGTVSTIEVPDRTRLARWTELTLKNNRVAGGMERAPRGFKNPGIEHVIYIVKENRTYDQVLGDVPRGNGDPKLCLFPRPVTPNQHALAERFVVLDNFYCCAEVSADGWNWSVSGMANEYTIRNSVYGYSGRGRTYDYEGTNNDVPVDLEGIPDVARAPSGYIWEQAARSGVSLRNYGFFVSVTPRTAEAVERTPTQGENIATKKLLTGVTDEDFLEFDMAYADSDAWVIHDAPAPRQTRAFGSKNSRSRFEEWKKEFDTYVKRGKLPRLMLVRLPRDHTQGTTPGHHSPRAMVADNDYALGQLVEAVSKSPFWKKTAIFVIEDDAQNGFDHVDAHRSICFVVSPFIKAGSVDHRFYNTDSVLRTIGLLHGMPPMGQYDAIANPLAMFSASPQNDRPYAAILPAKEIIGEVNRQTAYRARDSRRFDFSKEDSVPDQELNDILWRAVRGRGAPKPAIRYGLRVGLRDAL